MCDNAVMYTATEVDQCLTQITESALKDATTDKLQHPSHLLPKNIIEQIRNLLKQHCQPMNDLPSAFHRVGLSRYRLRLFLNNVTQRYRQALVCPGTPVGVLCGQSIGEPATQMTLKTFHFAGVASMNITQGVPRMQELVNAVTKIKTPIITVYLVEPTNEKLAFQVRRAIQPVTLDEIALVYRLFLC